ncbi:MAG TPA: sugar phosphate isomerase/epimerase [Bryobacteraceae bacterium]|nr:sugar phosphate isomerase/epimerase [Bryobacteraceae bacterium]
MRIGTGASDRRTFLKQVTAAAGGFALAGSTAELMAQMAPEWKNKIGIELYTVRNLLTPEAYESVLAKLAGMGYKEVEPADPYNRMEPAQYKALLDKYGLKMYSTHADATEGPELEKELEGQALMGIKYTAVRAPRRGGPGASPGRGPGAPGGPAGTGQQGRGPGAGGPGAGGPAAGGPRPQTQRPPQSVESVKRSCERMNKYGAVLQKFGMKYYIHNHATEFELLDDGRTTQYDVFLKETDAALVALQLDIGWAYMAGQDVLDMFKKNPGRYELWHVKDAKYKQADPTLTPNARARASQIVTMAEGDIDYKTVFANAKLAGLKHFVIEQDTAGQGGRDALEDCKIACQNLYKILS